jgi:hypothetical protein
MSDHIYEAKNIALYHEYKDLNGHLSHDAFMERHPKVNAYIVKLMKKHGIGSRSLAFDRAVWADPMHPDADDYADAYASSERGI